MHEFLKRIAKKLPGVRTLVAQRDALHAALQAAPGQNHVGLDMISVKPGQVQAELAELKRNQGFVPPGHFYSPIPDFVAIQKDRERIFDQVPLTIPGVAINAEQQLELLRRFMPYYAAIPFTAERQDGLRYYYDNPAYSWTDAIFLHCMIRHLQPRRIIEVGSGFSSCVTLDTNELFFAGSIETTFIEPYPELLLSLLKEQDRQHIKIIPTRLQDVDLGVFDALQANDILFIDSTHVSKIDSDVNRILFDILPTLAPGVHIHFHDIFYPFEYPDVWLLEGRAWNEAYILKAFLQYNSSFRVVLMSSFLARFHEQFLREHMPLCLNNTGGNLWLRKG